MFQFKWPGQFSHKNAEYMETISDICNEEALNKWNFVTEYLNDQIQHWSKAEPTKTDTAMVKALNRMMDKFRIYCQQVPLLCELWP